MLRAKHVSGQRVKILFIFAFLCVSEHFELIETHFFWKIFVSVKHVSGQRGKKIAFICVSDHFESTKTQFFFKKSKMRAQSSGELSDREREREA